MKARRRAFVVLVLTAVGVGMAAAPALGATATGPSVLLVTVEHAGFADLFGAGPGPSALAALGGTALVSQRIPLSTTLSDVFGSSRPFSQIDGGSVAAPDGGVDPTALSDVFARVRSWLAQRGSARVEVLLVSTSPSVRGVLSGDELGVLAIGVGTGAGVARSLAVGNRTVVPALTSDSTHRDGVVTTSDIAVTIATDTNTPVPTGVSGAPIRPADAPAPFALYQRYRDQRRLTVPIGVGTAIYAGLVGAFALAVAYRRSASARSRLAAGWAALSIVPLALALLEVGRLPRLTYAGVIPFLAGITIALTTAALALARRKGAVYAVVMLGAVVFLTLAVEAAMDWPGAVTPLLGGSQLDGGRFFGSPNAFAGLVLASGVFVALGLRSVWPGAALLFAAGLAVGSPWFGSDLGGAVTMCAVAGLWWSLRTHTHVLRAAIITGATAVFGAALVVLTQRYLASSPTHITQFAEGTGHAGGILGTLAERFRIGVKLLVTHPFALVPVVGVPAALWAVLRPGPRLGAVLGAEPTFAVAIVTILVGSLIAYAVNDTGASALGLGFGSAVAALLFVSLMGRDETVTA